MFVFLPEYIPGFIEALLAISELRPERKDVFLAKVDGDFVSDWVEKQHETFGDSALYILARMTDKMARMLLVDDVPEDMNRDSYLLLSAVSKEKNLPEITCVINFGSMDQQLAQLLGEQEFLLIKSNSGK